MAGFRAGSIVVVWVVVLAAIAGAIARVAAADDGTRTVLFVIDGSGSMWGRFEAGDERRAKVDVVRDLVRPIIAADTHARIGLQSFGHRRRGDCSDVEVIAPPATDRAAVLAGIDKLNPRGKGPLAEALRQAAQAVGAERPASIIVIHDGVDNCRQDACAAAADFAKAAPGVPSHMIAIGVPQSEQQAVQCVAKATGGKFYDVRDPVALAAAIQDATALALGSPNTQEAPAAGKDDKTAAEAAAALPQAAVRATLALSEGQPALTTPVTWRITKRGSDAPVRVITAAAIAENIEPGQYTLSAERDGLVASAPLSIEAGKSVTLALTLKAGRLVVKSKAAKTLPLIAIKETADGKTAGRTLTLSKSENADVFLPPATYLITLTAGDLRQDMTVKLTEGSEAVADFDAGVGTLALKAALQEGGAPLPDVSFSIQEDDPDSAGGRREVRRSRAADPQFILPSGTYYAVARAGYAETRQRIALSAGENLEKTLIIQAADVTLSASIGSGAAPGSAGLVFHIVSLDGDPREIARGPGPVFNGLLNAGRYRVTASLERHAASASQDIVVEAGKALSRILKLDAGEIALKGAGPAMPDVFWEVRDAAGKPVWHGAAAEPRVLLAPGRYSVRMEHRDRTIEAAFTVAAGDNKVIEVGAH